MDELIPIALFICMTFTIVALGRIISDGRTRRKLIEAGATSEIAEAVAKSTRDQNAVDDALKWGLVIGAVGIALIIVQFLPYGPEEPISIGLVLLFAAAGLLTSVLLSRRLAGGSHGEIRRVT